MNPSHSSNPPMPDFLVIGGMKCGTTTLWEYLDQHPGIHMSPNKEPSYFSDPAVWEKGECAYRQLFTGAEEGQLCGEASTSYSRFEEYRIGVKPETWVTYLDTPAQIAAAVPHAKLIYMLRHPVERAYSHYGFLMQYDAMLSLDDALEHHTTIIESSKYILQIRRYLDHFPREQLLCVILDDFEKDPDGELRRIQDFLGVAAVPLAAETLRSNPSGAGYAGLRFSSWMDAARRNPALKALSRLAPGAARRFVREGIVNALSGSFLGKRLAARHRQTISPFSDEARTHLHEILDPATLELEEFLGREMPHWRG